MTCFVLKLIFRLLPSVSLDHLYFVVADSYQLMSRYNYIHFNIVFYFFMKMSVTSDYSQYELGIIVCPLCYRPLYLIPSGHFWSCCVLLQSDSLESATRTWFGVCANVSR